MPVDPLLLKNSREDIIDINNISFRYPYESIRTLTNISIKFKSGYVTAIVGNNGSGKSTLVRCISGLLKISAGEITIRGVNPQNNLNKIIKFCSYISQQPTMDSEMTGEEVLDYFASMYGLTKKQRKERVTELIKLMHIETLRFKKICTYSGGNLQRLHLAIGLINKPQIMLFDEPTSNLDTVSKNEFWSYLKQLSTADCKTSVVVSHDLTLVEKYADDLIVMDHGNILYQGSLNEFIKTTSSQAKYLKQHQYSNNQAKFAKPINNADDNLTTNMSQVNHSFKSLGGDESLDEKQQSPSDFHLMVNSGIKSTLSLSEALCQLIHFDDQKTNEDINQKSHHRGQGRNLNRNRRRR